MCLSDRLIYQKKNFKNYNLAISSQVNELEQNNLEHLATKFLRNISFQINNKEFNNDQNVNDSLTIVKDRVQIKKSFHPRYQETFDKNESSAIKKNLSITNYINNLQIPDNYINVNNLPYKYSIEWLDRKHVSLKSSEKKFVLRILPLENLQDDNGKVKIVSLFDLFTQSITRVMHGTIGEKHSLDQYSLFSYEKAVFLWETYLKNLYFKFGLNHPKENFIYIKNLFNFNVEEYNHIPSMANQITVDKEPKAKELEINNSNINDSLDSDSVGSTPNQITLDKESESTNLRKIDNLTVLPFSGDPSLKISPKFLDDEILMKVKHWRFPIIFSSTKALNESAKRLLPDKPLFKNCQGYTYLKDTKSRSKKILLEDLRPKFKNLPLSSESAGSVRIGLNCNVGMEKLKHISNSNLYLENLDDELSKVLNVNDTKDIELNFIDDIKLNLIDKSYNHSYISQKSSFFDDILRSKKKEKTIWGSDVLAKGKLYENIGENLEEHLYALKNFIIRVSTKSKKKSRNVRSRNPIIIGNKNLNQLTLSPGDFKETFLTNLLDYVNKSNDLRYSQININFSNIKNLRDSQLNKIKNFYKNFLPTNIYVPVDPHKKITSVSPKLARYQKFLDISKISDPIQKLFSLSAIVPFFAHDSTLYKSHIWQKNQKRSTFKIKKRFKSYNELKIKCIKKQYILHGVDKRKYEKLFQRFLSYKAGYGLHTKTRGLKYQKFRHTRMCSIKNRLRLNSKNYLINNDRRFSLLYDKVGKSKDNKYKNENILYSDIYDKDQNKRNVTKKKDLYRYVSNIDIDKLKDIKTISIDLKQKKHTNVIPLSVRLSPSEFFKKKFFIANAQDKWRFFKNKDIQKHRRLKKLKKLTADDEYRYPPDPRAVFLYYRTFKRYLTFRYPLVKNSTKEDICLNNKSKESTYHSKDKDYNHIFKLSSIWKGYLKNQYLEDQKVRDIDQWLSDLSYIYNYQSINSNGKYMYSHNKSALSYLEKPHLYKVKHNTIYSNLGIGRNVKKKIYRPHLTCTYENPDSQKIVLHNMCTRKNLDVFSFYVKDLYKIPKKIKKRYKRKS